MPDRSLCSTTVPLLGITLLYMLFFLVSQRSIPHAALGPIGRTLAPTHSHNLDRSGNELGRGICHSRSTRRHRGTRSGPHLAALAHAGGRNEHPDRSGIQNRHAPWRTVSARDMPPVIPKSTCKYNRADSINETGSCSCPKQKPPRPAGTRHQRYLSYFKWLVRDVTRSQWRRSLTSGILGFAGKIIQTHSHCPRPVLRRQTRCR